MEDYNSQALQESQALNQIVLDLLTQKKKEHLRLWIIILALILINLLEVSLFIWYESNMEVSEVTTTTTTSTTTVEQDTGEGNGNNIYQSGEYAQYQEGGD